MKYLFRATLFSCLLPFIMLSATAAPLKTQGKTQSDPKNTANELANTADKQKLASIEIIGVEGDLKKNIELHMPVTIPVCHAERAEVRQFFTTVKKQLRKAARALGYYDAEFRSGGKKVNGCWKLHVRVTPGKPVKVVSQTIKVIGEGRNEPIFKKILQEPPYKIGDVLNHQKYTDYKTRLAEAAQSLGYFDAEFIKHEIKVDPVNHQAKVTLIMDTGKRYRYGKITIKQNILSQKVMKSYLLIKEGEPYKTEDLINQQLFLQQTGYFKLVKVEVLHEQANNYQIPIVITLTPKKRNAYKFKLGYGSDTGGRVSAEMNRRWTGSKGKHLKIAAQYAQNLSGISMQLISPRKNPVDDSLVYNIDWKQDKNDDVISRSINVGGQFTRKRSSGWIQTASIGYLVDKTQVKGDIANNSTLLLFGVGLEKIKADNLIFPNDGWRFKTAMTLAFKGALSDQNVGQFQILGKRIKSFGEHRFIGRFHIGTTHVSDFDKLPKSLRFFSGGGNSVRGYTFESLGEINADGKVIGGKHLLNLSLEYQYPITDQWSAAAFVDAGNAFNDWQDYSVKVGVGFGARWRSPIGPVRIDIGFPKDDFKQPHLHLSVGSDL